jgi:hypothetical protein
MTDQKKSRLKDNQGEEEVFLFNTRYRCAQTSIRGV